MLRVQFCWSSVTNRSSLWAVCVRVDTHSGMEPSSFIHGQESVTVDPFDANDPLRNRKELQDTWADKQHAAMTDRWCKGTPLLLLSSSVTDHWIWERLCCLLSSRNHSSGFISFLQDAILCHQYPGVYKLLVWRNILQLHNDLLNYLIYNK